MWCKVILTFSALFHVVISLHLPPEIQICKRADSKCLKDAIQDAVPKLEKGLSGFNLPQVQPLHVPSLTVGEGTGVAHVVQNYKNMNIYDVINAKIDNVETKATDKELDITVDASLPSVKIESDYELDGRILVVPIVGKGTCTIVFRDLKARITIHSEVFEKKGTDYLEIKEFKMELKPENILLDFKNLFDGDERLGTEMNKLLNDNWKDIWEDVRVGYEEALGAILKSLANVIFKKVPYAELFPQ